MSITRPSATNARTGARVIERPSHEQLKRDVAATSMLAVGHKYGVSENAVRKWLRWYAASSEARA